MPNTLLRNRQLGSDVARVNLLVNGGFEWWQRGTTFTQNAAGQVYGADRWYGSLGGAGSLTVAKDTTNVDSSGTAAALTVTYSGVVMNFWQVLEDVKQIRGHQATLSIRVRCATANAVRASLWDNGVIANGAYHPGDGTYRTLTVTGSFVATAGQVAVGLDLGASCTAYVDNAMFVLGGQACDYVPLPPADDLARCLRYYEILMQGNATLYLGQVTGAGSAYVPFSFKVQKAVTPTMTFSGTATLLNSSAGVGYAITSYTGGWASPTNGSCQFTASSGALTAGNATMVQPSSGVVTAEANP